MTVDRRYRVIYADPPWFYRDSAKAGSRGSVFKYPLMPDDEVIGYHADGVPIHALAHQDSWLFLWSTWPKLPIALEVMAAWGFTYRSVGFLWAKTTKHGKWHMGMGSHTRANTEPCLLGVRGKPKRQSASVRQLVVSPIREHSRKPDEVRDSIVKLCGDVPRMELFATGEYDGWETPDRHLTRRQSV